MEAAPAAPTGAATTGAAPAAPTEAPKEEEPAKPGPVRAETPFTGTHAHKITTEAKDGGTPRTIIQSDPMPADVLLDRIASCANLLDPTIAATIAGRVKTAKDRHQAVLNAADARQGAKTLKEQQDLEVALKQAQDALAAEVGPLLSLYEEQGLLVASAVGFKASGEALRLLVHQAVEDMTKLDVVQRKLDEILAAPAHGPVPVTPGAGMIALGKGMADRPDVAPKDRIDYKMPDGQTTQERRQGDQRHADEKNKLGMTVVLNADRSNKEGVVKQPYGVDTYEQVLAHVREIVDLLANLEGWNEPPIGPVSERTIATIMRTYARTGAYPEDLPSNHRARINELMLLLFGREAARDLGNTAFTPMALDLIASGASSFKDQLNQDDANLGGGNHPTSFAGSKNKGGAGPSQAAQADKEIRAAANENRDFKLPTLPTAKEASRQRAIDELVKREIALAEAYLRQVAPTAWAGAVFFENQEKCKEFVVKKMLAFYGVKGEKLAEKIQSPPPEAAPPSLPPPPPPQAQSPAPSQQQAAQEEPSQQQAAPEAAAPPQPMPSLLPLTPEAPPKETKPQAGGTPPHAAPGPQANPQAPQTEPKKTEEDDGKIEPSPIIKTQAVAGLLSGLKRLFGAKDKQKDQQDPAKEPAAAKDGAKDGGSAEKEKHAAAGLASRVAMEPFVAAAKGIADRWAELQTPDARIGAFVAAANEQLQAAGVPGCKPVPADLPLAVKGRFDWTPWIIEMSKPLFTDPPAEIAVIADDPAAAHASRMADVSSIVYHEARHAEQLFNVARLLAGKKKSAAEIKTAMEMQNDTVVAQAIANPLGTNDPATTDAQGHFDSIFGKDAQARDAKLKRLETTAAALMQAKEHAERCRAGNEPAQIRQAANAAETKAKQAQRDAEAEYKALPEEADAFAVQEDIRNFFLFPG